MKCTIKSRFVDDTGIVERKQYADGSLALTFTSEDGEPLLSLSTNLSGYGLEPPPGCIFVKDYSEGEGLAEAMERAGIGTRVGTATFGPYQTTATVMVVSV